MLHYVEQCRAFTAHAFLVFLKGGVVLAISFFLAVHLQTDGNASEYSGSSRDLSLMAAMQSTGDKYVSGRSVLWVEKGYMAGEEARLLQQRIDQAISSVEDFTGIEYASKAYGKERIEYFVHSGREASHTIAGYQPRKYMHPVVFLSFAAERNAPYVHETVHIIAWDWSAPWMEEGLAVFLNDELSGYPSYPNFGEDLDKLAKSALQYQSALRKVGRSELPEFPSEKERRAYYILSGSFIKYIHTQIGMEQLMEIYRAGDTQKAFYRITGRSLGVIKNEWVHYVKVKD